MDGLSWSTGISACEKGSQLEEALGLLQKTVHQFLTPNVVGGSTAINACGKSQQ